MSVMTTDTTGFRVAGLTDDEAGRLGAMIDRIVAHQNRNLQLVQLYEGAHVVRDLGIALPPEMRDVLSVVGWPAIAVDALEERLDIEGFAWPDGSIENLGVDEIVAENDLLVESGLGHLDSLIHGISFAAVSHGDTSKGEPEALITLEPPTRMTVEWDRRLRRASAAAFAEWDECGELSKASLYLPHQTVHLVRDGGWQIEDVQEHKLGRVPVVRLVNRPRGSRVWGATEITRPVIAFTEMACRSLLRMEVSAEFYSAPQRWAMGVRPEDFQDANGNQISAWKTVMGVLWAMGRDPETNEAPTVGQFPAQSPAPNLDQIKGLASLFAAEAAIPVTYLGFHTQNPPGGDGIRAAEARLVKRAERRQRVFGLAWPELIRLSLLVRDGELPPKASRISTVWRDASTPTAAATADQVLKYVSSGVLRPDSEITWERAGFDEGTRSRLVAERRRESGSAALRAIVEASRRNQTVTGADASPVPE